MGLEGVGRAISSLIESLTGVDLGLDFDLQVSEEGEFKGNYIPASDAEAEIYEDFEAMGCEEHKQAIIAMIKTLDWLDDNKQFEEGNKLEEVIQIATRCWQNKVADGVCAYES